MQMRTEVLKDGIGLRRRGRAGRFAFIAAAFVVAAFVAAPASAQLPLDLDVPTLPPLPLPTLAPLPDVDVMGTVNGVINTVTSVPDGLGVIVPPDSSRPVVRQPNRAPALRAPEVDGWSIERLPALSGAVNTNVPPTSVSSSWLGRPGSYTSVVGDGFRAAAGRAAHLVGPLAAPLLVAMFAIVTLVLAARGPGQLVKVEEDRQGLRERRSYRL
jgi:hypothetical protein